MSIPYPLVPWGSTRCTMIEVVVLWNLEYHTTIRAHVNGIVRKPQILQNFGGRVLRLRKKVDVWEDAVGKNREQLRDEKV